MIAEQDPETSVHREDGLNVAFESLDVKLTFPVGEWPVTITAQVVLEPIVIEFGAHVITVDDDCVPTVRG